MSLVRAWGEHKPVLGLIEDRCGWSGRWGDTHTDRRAETWNSNRKLFLSIFWHAMLFKHCKMLLKFRLNNMKQLRQLKQLKQLKQHLLNNWRLKLRLLQLHRGEDRRILMETVTQEKPSALIYSSKRNHCKTNLILLSFREGTSHITGCWFQWEYTPASPHLLHSDLTIWERALNMWWAISDAEFPV